MQATATTRTEEEWNEGELALFTHLGRLGPNACLGDLPAHDFAVEASTPSQVVADEFKRRPQLPAVVVELPESEPQLISQQMFYKLLSRPFGIEVFLRRPIRSMLKAVDFPTFRLEPTCPVAAAAQQALARPTRCVYEPVLVQEPAGAARSVDVHVLLLAQSQLLKVAQLALVQSDKLASLGQLAAGVAHEINNPLAFALNNVQVLRRDLKAAMAILEVYRRARPRLRQTDPELAAEAARQEEEWDLDYILQHFDQQFEKGVQGLNRVRDIVQNLRDFVRLDEAEFSEADLNGALRSALEIINHEVKKKSVGVELQLSVLPPVLCHPRKLNQVFLNLLMNAVQSCAAAGGRVLVRTRPEAGAVLIEVEDNGCGIPPEHLPRIFDPFFTTKPVGQGTGLGLSVSFGIIRDHGGSITVDSQVGRGSVFRVRLPVRSAGSGAC
jgi:signal transduction histidine kinase